MDTPGESLKPTRHIDLARLERETRRLLALGFLFAIMLHALLALFFSGRGQVAPLRTETDLYRIIRGVFLHDRLALVYSEKKYGEKWGDERKVESGVNLLVYALLSGVKTRKLVDSSASPDRDYKKWWTLDDLEQVRELERRAASPRSR